MATEYLDVGNTTNTDPKVFDCRVNGWGKSNELQWGDSNKTPNEDGSWNTHGCLTPTPQNGDFVRKGSGHILQLFDVKYPSNRNPKGLYFAKAFIVGSVVSEPDDQDPTDEEVLDMVLKNIADNPDDNKAKIIYKE